MPSLGLLLYNSFMRWRGVLLVFGCLSIVVSTLYVQIPRAQAAGATYYFSPSSLRLNTGQTATVSLFVASPDEAINAGDGTIVIPSAYAVPVSVNKSGSIFSLWPEEPTVSGSTIRFAGGRSSPGYQGTGGRVLSFTVRGSAEGTGLITLTGGRILANNASSTNIFSGAGTATVTVTRVVAGATISSTTHPDQNAWYKTQDVAVSWTKPSGATTFSYSLTHSADQPTQSGSGVATSATFSGLAEGVWTLTLTTTFNDGKTATSSFTVRIDTTAPAAFSTTVEQQGTGDPRPTLKFSTTDQPSGIQQYEILIDGKSIGATPDSQFQLPIQLPGTHTFIVRAYDRAGNTTDSTGTFTVEGFAGPVLTSWPNFISVLEPLFFKGKGRYDSKIILYIDGQPVGDFFVKENLSDDAKRSTDLSTVDDNSQVEWSYTYRGAVTPGQHIVYAHQQRPDGALSNRSNEVSVTVLWTVVRIFGVTIPTFLLGIIGLGILTILLIFLWYRFRLVMAFIRRRIKRAEEEVDHDLTELEKGVGKNNARLRRSIEQTKVDVENELDNILRKNNKK